jgi:3-isopropylmalate/(R)-2-methylmalate dehydratase small subunit
MLAYYPFRLALLSKIFKAIVTNQRQVESTFLNKLLRLKQLEKKSFDISGLKKANMINGFDDIDYLQNIKRK